MEPISYKLPPPEERTLLRTCIEEAEGGRALPPATLRRHYDCAVQLFYHHAGTEWVATVSDALNKDVSSWLLDLPRALRTAGFIDEAIDHANRWSMVEHRAAYLSECAAILGMAGRAGEMNSRIDIVDKEFPEDVWAQMRCGDALMSIGDAVGAEARYRRVFALSNDRHDRVGVVERMIICLRSQGRGEEASLWARYAPERSFLCYTLRENWFLSASVIQAVMDSRDFFQSYFRNVLTLRVRLPEYSDLINDNTDLHAILFLMEWGDDSLVPPLLSLLSADEDSLEERYGDTLTTMFWLPIARTGHSHLPLIRDFVTDTTKNLYARMSVMDGVIALPHFHPDRRTEVISFIESVLDESEAFTADVFAGFLCDCADSGLNELAAVSAEFADAMSQGEFMFGAMATANDIRTAWKEGPQSGFISDRSTTIFAVNAEWKSWDERVSIYEDNEEDYLDDEYRSELSRLEEFVEPTNKKIGRNEPCPCGSGKKYKKCHGA